MKKLLLYILVSVVFLSYVYVLQSKTIANNENNEYQKEDEAYELHMKVLDEVNELEAEKMYQKIIDEYNDTEYYKTNEQAIKAELDEIIKYLEVEFDAEKLCEEAKSYIGINDRVALNLFFGLKDKYKDTDYFKNNYREIKKMVTGLGEKIELEEKMAKEKMEPDKVLVRQMLSATVYIKITQKEEGFAVSDEEKDISTGSGFIVSDKGIIITAAHVAEDSKDVDLLGLGYIKGRIIVKLNDATTIEAKEIDKDESLDIAILKLDESKLWDYTRKNSLTALELGNSDDIYEGQEIFIVGSPHALEQSVTKGVISHVAREFPDEEGKYIQTDAAIYPGNSGSPVVTKQGKVIGVVNYYLYRQEQLNLSVPINKIKERFSKYL